jgi:hypothetical protein
VDLNVPREIDSPTVISDEVSGEVLAINIGTGAYFVIPPTSLDVWRALTSGVPAMALLNGPDDPRAGSLREFVASLVNAGLLRDAGAATELSEDVSWSPTDLVVEQHTDMADLLWLDVIHDVDENVGWPLRRADV